MTPLHIAARVLAIDAARILLEAGADPNVYADYQLSPLHCVAETYARHRNRITTDQRLWFMVQGKYPFILDLLVNHGARLDALDARRRTALDLAIFAGDDTLAEALRKRMAAPIGTREDISKQQSDNLPGDELWSMAITASNSNRSDEARRLFALAIRKNPWKYCGIGADSCKPAQPTQQSLWLQGMADAGLHDVVAAIATPPQLSDATIVGLMAYDERCKEILDKACARLGIART
jgi:hypothetical protein